jgi:hypothetical protein
MKNFIYTIILLITVLTTSCEVKIEPTEKQTNVSIYSIKRNYDLIPTHFEYDGHKYILFKILQGAKSSIVHDPNCPCNNKQK